MTNETTSTPPSPFASWQIGMSDPTGFPLVTLVQAALGGTVDDRISEHALGLFAELDERGLDAWRETAVMLVQFLLSGGHYGTGNAAATRYLNDQPAPSRDTPALNLMHILMSVFIGSGRQMTERVLAGRHHTEAEITGATRLLFCTAAGASGYPVDAMPRLLDELCAGVR